MDGWVFIVGCSVVSYGSQASLQFIIHQLYITELTQIVHLQHRRATSPLHRWSTWPWAENMTQLSHRQTQLLLGVQQWIVFDCMIICADRATAGAFYNICLWVFHSFTEWPVHWRSAYYRTRRPLHAEREGLVPDFYIISHKNVLLVAY